MIQSIAAEFEQPISSSNMPSPVVLDRYWVAIHDKEIVGTIGVLKLAPNSAVLKRMFVQKEYRGKDYGISASLLNQVLVWSSDEGIDTIYLGTMSQFKAAHKFYEKHGFKAIGASATAWRRYVTRLANARPLRVWRYAPPLHIARPNVSYESRGLRAEFFVERQYLSRVYKN